MIKFFRKIRQNLLSDGKTGKYLKYALGEILLVVIGILIALQLNNLNEDRKIDNLRKVYYNQLLLDLEKDKNYMEEKTLVLDSNMVRRKMFLKTFEQPDLPIIQILQNFGSLNWDNEIIQFQSNTISTLQNTGDIKIIPIIIKNKLIDFRRRQNLAVEVSEKNLLISEEMSAYASRYYGSQDLIQRIGNQPKLAAYFSEENRQMELLMAFESTQFLKNYAESGNISYFEELKLEIDEIAKLINNELEK